MPELDIRPVQSPAKGLMTCDHDPALWRIATLRYRDHLTRGGGIFYVGIPPDPDSPEAANWIWRSRSEIVVRPPFTFRILVLEENGIDSGVVSDYVVTERFRCWTTYSDKHVYWDGPPDDPRDEWKTMSWPQAATALLAPERMIHGWEPRWEHAIPNDRRRSPGHESSTRAEAPLVG